MTVKSEELAPWQACVHWGGGVDSVSALPYGTNEDPEEWDTDGFAGSKTVQSVGDYIQVWWHSPSLGWRFAYFLDIGDGPCSSDTPTPHVPANVCVDISLDTLYEWTNHRPQEGRFYVDGYSYLLGDGIYWAVPEGDVWEWDIYIDGLLLLTLKNEGEGLCFVSEVYRQ